MLSEEVTAVLLRRLRDHEIDIAVVATREDEDDLVERFLFDEPLWLAMPAAHALVERPVVDADALADPGLPVLTLAEGHCLADRVRELCSISAGEAPFVAAHESDRRAARQHYLYAWGLAFYLVFGPAQLDPALWASVSMVRLSRVESPQDVGVLLPPRLEGG